MADVVAAQPTQQAGAHRQLVAGIMNAVIHDITDAEAEEFRHFLDARQITEEDRVIRRIALRGFATQGIALARADLVPEITITADGVYWHPVGAEDVDLLVTAEIFPLAEANRALNSLKSDAIEGAAVIQVRES